MAFVKTITIDGDTTGMIFIKHSESGDVLIVDIKKRRGSNKIMLALNDSAGEGKNKKVFEFSVQEIASEKSVNN